MLDWFQGIADTITNIFNFFAGIIDAIGSFVENVKAWWENVLIVLDALPGSVVVIAVAAFVLLLVFIVVELLRDFL